MLTQQGWLRDYITKQTILEHLEYVRISTYMHFLSETLH